jgi:hypothetical protein
MQRGKQIMLADYNETGSTGIYQLKRLWSKAIAGQETINKYPNEIALEKKQTNACIKKVAFSGPLFLCCILA